jgi:hypothetical protein
MDVWCFRCYLDADGNDVIDAWYQAQSEKLQAKFDARVRFLRQQPRGSWVRPYFDTLGEGCAGLGELRFEHKNVQWRIIGFASAQMEYTWVFVANEVGDKFEPKNTCSKSQERKAEIVNNRNKARDCNFD